MSEKHVQICQQYKQVFQANGLDIQIMPLRAGNKMPMYKHKGGVYDDSKVIFEPRNWIDKAEKLPCNMAWLLDHQIFCIDLDGSGETVEQKQQSAQADFDMIEEQYGLAGAWVEKTRKGYHLIWKKPESMRDITTHTDAFRDAGFPNIDLLTISSSEHDGVPTKGMLTVYPSNNKQWLEGHNPLAGATISEPPVGLVDWIKQNINQKSKKQKQTANQIKQRVVVKERVRAHGTSQEIDELQQILTRLPSKYYEIVSDGGDWTLWHKVMLGIQFLMGEEGYETWAKFNRRAKSWTEDMQAVNRARYWEPNLGVYTDTPIGIGSFRFWLKTDFPEAWKEVRATSLTSQRFKALDGTWHELAVLASIELPYIKYNEITGHWCKFQDGAWNTDYQQLIVDLNQVVRKNLQESLTKYYLEKQASIEHDPSLSDEDKEAKLKHTKERLLKVIKVANKIGNDPNKLIAQLKSVVNQKLVFDENPWLLGFKGGWVYDLKECYGRLAEMDDMVSMQVGYTFDEIMNANKQEVQQVVEDILPDPEVREFQMYLLALALNGVEAKRFCCQNGSGANGKSTLFGLLKRALGDYCKNISTAHYTTPFKENGPRPDLLDLQGTRMFIATEPSEGERFNSGSIKKITGGDPIRCRGMWQGKTTEFSVVGQHNVLCNDKPAIQGIDQGFLRRVIDIEYPVKFCRNPNPENPLEKPINMKFKSDSWFAEQGAGMLAWLIQLHDQYLEKGLVEYELDPPLSIANRTKEWVAESDPFKAFIEDIGEPDLDGTFLKVKDLYAAFKQSDSFGQMTKKEQRVWCRRHCVEKLIVHPQWLAVYGNREGAPNITTIQGFFVKSHEMGSQPDEGCHLDN